jgi:cell wall-associated NlpC family hydrolase
MDVVIPEIEPLVEPLLGLPYAECDCWQLLRRLFGQGWGIDLDADPAVAVAQVQEIWWRGDAREPVALSQPWDIWIMRNTGLASSHVGVVVNQTHMIHTGEKLNVCLQLMRIWRPWLLQMARLRRLL